MSTWVAPLRCALCCLLCPLSDNLCVLPSSDFWVLDLMSKQERDKPLGYLHVCLIILAEVIEAFGFLPLCCEKQKQ